jgi:hypothetical protein
VPAALPRAPSGSTARLEALLEFDDAEVAWHGGVGGVHRNLTGGRRLAGGMSLGLVVSVLEVLGPGLGLGLGLGFG